MGDVIAISCMALMIVSWIVGMVSYTRLATKAGVTGLRAWYSFAVYRYAFTEGKGSAETKLMLIGFLGMFVWLGLGVWLPTIVG
jgi:hypothetical protein